MRGSRIKDLLRGDWLGVRFAANVFIATSLLWVLLQHFARLNPIWAISSMVAASDPKVTEARKMLRGRVINALVGCAVGLLFLAIGGSRLWKLPVALAITVLLSTYVVRVQVMWRQAPITAAIVIASELEKHSKMTSLQSGLRRVGEVLLGCFVGLAVSWLMSWLWPAPKAGSHETSEATAPVKP